MGRSDALGFVVIGGAAAVALYFAFDGSAGGPGAAVRQWLGTQATRAEGAALTGLDSYLQAGQAAAPKLHAFDWVQPLRPPAQPPAGPTGKSGGQSVAAAADATPAPTPAAPASGWLSDLWGWFNKPYAGPPQGNLSGTPGGSLGIPDFGEVPIPVGG